MIIASRPAHIEALAAALAAVAAVAVCAGALRVKKAKRSYNA